jgi:hypothetical protein
MFVLSIINKKVMHKNLKNILIPVFVLVSSLILMSFYVDDISKNNIGNSINFNIDLLNQDSIEIAINKRDSLVQDSIFGTYKSDADLFLSREIFNGTPITGDVLFKCAKRVYDSTNVFVPLELVLAQAQLESGMGKVKNSKYKNNFFGIMDGGNLKRFKTVEDGIEGYYMLMSTKYLRCKTVDELLRNFTNCGGKRYASETYEASIRKQYHTVKSWIRNNRES